METQKNMGAATNHAGSRTTKAAQYFPENRMIACRWILCQIWHVHIQRIVWGIRYWHYQALMTWALGYFFGKHHPLQIFWTEVKASYKFCKIMDTIVHQIRACSRDLPLPILRGKRIEANLRNVDQMLMNGLKRAPTCDNEEAILLGKYQTSMRTYYTHEKHTRVVRIKLGYARNSTAQFLNCCSNINRFDETGRGWRRINMSAICI